MKKIFKTVVFCAFICAAFFTPAKAAYAHPHVFIDTAIEFVWQGKKLQGAYIEWTFDKMFSNEIISWLDADHNGKFSDAESEAVFVVSQAASLIKSGAYKAQDIAILFRTYSNQSLYEAQLRLQGIGFWEPSA